MKKLFVIAAACIALASPVSAQTILALNAAGPVGQLNLLTIQSANQNNIAGFQAVNEFNNQAAGNAAAVDQTNDVAFLTANAQFGITQVNLGTIQSANQNNVAFFQLGNTMNNSAIGNIATVSQLNDTALGVVNLQTGITQFNVLTVQSANQNNVALVQAGNTASNAAAGNVASITSIN